MVPNPSDPESFTRKSCTANGIHIEYVDENEQSDNIILLIHGWPDLWLGWREQIPFLVNLGYRVIVPSLRGFGNTDAPEDPNEYGYANVSKDLAALLDHLKVKMPIIVVGHDWGGFVAWRFTQFYPDRVKAVASFCTPYAPPSPVYVPLEDIVKALPNFSYQLYLVTPEAEKDLNGNFEKFFKRIYRPISDAQGALIDRETGKLAEGRPDVERSEKLPQKVLDFYVKTYEARGARGGLNWYKQTKNNFEQCKHLGKTIDKPAMMVTAEGDRALPPSMASKMPDYIPDLEMHNIKDAGHWVLWEKPDECNAYLKGWLAKVDSGSRL